MKIELNIFPTMVAFFQAVYSPTYKVYIVYIVYHSIDTIEKKAKLCERGLTVGETPRIYRRNNRSNMKKYILI